MKRLFDVFKNANKELFLVGGAVRDIALGIDMKDLDDLDFCTNALPEETLKILRDNKFSTYEMGFEFGTVGATLRGTEDDGFPKDVQVTTYRSAEFYRRGSRHPVVKFGTTIDQDLMRRDFSINSIALDAEGNFFDPYDGLGDLKKGVLRVVSDPFETLAEDPLRILRVARFVSRLGFSIDPKLFEAACARAKNIEDISKERWLQEMNKLLVGKYVEDAFRFLAKTGVMHVILPELWNGESVEERELPQKVELALPIIKRAKINSSLRWGILLHEVSSAENNGLDISVMLRKLGKRFTFDNESLDVVNAIFRYQERILEYKSSEKAPFLRRLFIELEPYFEMLCDFAEAKEPGFDIESLKRRIEILKSENTLVPDLPAGIGKEIMREFSLKPSREVGVLKNKIEDAIIEGELENGKNESYYLAFLKTEKNSLP